MKKNITTKILLEKFYQKKIRKRKNSTMKKVKGKEKKHQYRWDWNKNISKEEKQKKVEYMKNYYVMHKN